MNIPNHRIDLLELRCDMSSENESYTADLLTDVRGVVLHGRVNLTNNLGREITERMKQTTARLEELYLDQCDITTHVMPGVLADLIAAVENVGLNTKISEAHCAAIARRLGQYGVRLKKLLLDSSTNLDEVTGTTLANLLEQAENVETVSYFPLTIQNDVLMSTCLLYTSPSPRDS